MIHVISLFIGIVTLNTTLGYGILSALYALQIKFFPDTLFIYRNSRTTSETGDFFKGFIQSPLLCSLVWPVFFVPSALVVLYWSMNALLNKVSIGYWWKILSLPLSVATTPLEDNFEKLKEERDKY